MNKVIYAVFDDEAEAEAARSELEHHARHCSVIVHRGAVSSEELELDETAARAGIVHGVVILGTLGAFVGAAVAGPIGLVVGRGIAAMLGGLLGSVLGGVTMMLVESGSPDRRLEALGSEIQKGKVVLTIEAPSRTCREKAELALRQHRARMVRRSFA